MKIVRTRAELRVVLAGAPRPVGLVPTMGWLHDGHVSLVRRARAESETVVVTIFVNPRQFAEASDFTQYPRNEARDLALCEAAGVDLVFAPPVEEVYPPGFDTVVRAGRIAEPLEGAARPGHFDGVATVVAILFALVHAERAYFGLKDYQQIRVIRRMAWDLALPTEVIPCPTVREPDGLAMSSRNARLTAEDRAAATVLHRALLAARARCEAGETSTARLRAVMRDVLEAEPRAAVEYVSVADAVTLEEVDVAARPALLSLAARFGDVRLIDNELLDGEAPGETAGSPPWSPRASRTGT